MISNIESTIAFDESGNTGSDLLDKVQPVFVLASVRYSEQEAKELLECFSLQKKNEVKFKNLRNPSYWKDVDKFLSHPLIQKDRIKIAVVDKQYSIAVHTVDRLIEEVAYRDGFDLYDKGANLGMANLLHYTMKVFTNEILWKQYKVSFMNMFRRQTPQDIRDFFSTVREMIDVCKDEQFKGILYAIMHSSNLLEQIFAGWNKYSFDPALTALFNLCDSWGKDLGGYFDVVTDESKPLQFFEEYINIFKSPELAERVLGYDRRTYNLPLKIRELAFKDSIEVKSIQIADIVSGAVYDYHKSLIIPETRNGLTEIIGNSKLIEFITCIVWPHAAFTPAQLDTEGPNHGVLNDEMAKEIRAARKKNKQ